MKTFVASRPAARSCVVLALFASFVTVALEPGLVEARQSQDIFVFMDGTDNAPETHTNVWRLAKWIDWHDRKAEVLYRPGVGTTSAGLPGSALGLGMQRRILEGYRFVTDHFLPGDKVFIFGFSRGAHQARALAGLLSYAGVPVRSAKGEVPDDHVLERILDHVKDVKEPDEPDAAYWASADPPLAKDLPVRMQPVRIAFLGVWDTVPGSSFKEFDPDPDRCGEKEGFFKRHVPWLTPARGDRYKYGSYPPIERIAHAVAADEKRSKFKPILLCKPVDPSRTRITEVWFPGAHADVGGGYNDCGLAGISLNWMIAQLAEVYRFPGEPPRFAEDPLGMAHWSIAVAPANAGSSCQDRDPLAGAMHPSRQARKDAAADRVWLEVKGTPYALPYPILCSELGKENCGTSELLTRPSPSPRPTATACSDDPLPD